MTTLDLQPATQAESASSSAPEPDQAPEHLDAIEIEIEADSSADEPSGPAGGPIGADGLLTGAAFADGLGKVLLITGHATGLETVLRSPDEPTYPDAAGAMYDAIRDVPALHFLLRPGGLWVQRAAAIALWAVPLGAGVRRELRTRRAPPPPPSDGDA